MTRAEFRGPLFDGSAEWMLTHGIETARLELAQQAQDAVELEGLQFKNPSGRYMSLLHIKNESFSSRVLPGILPYVRWLEGTSRRNFTTRFKGYRLFRNAFQRVEARAKDLFEFHLRPVIDRING
jgi:hypothetical protein